MRLLEETSERPKPLVEICGKPILYNIMKIYEHYGHRDFIICLGYKSYMIKEYFMHFKEHNNNFSLNTTSCIPEFSDTYENWNVSLVNTGEDTNTGGRLLRVKPYIKEELFGFTYGDGLTNANINKIIDLHDKTQKLVTFLGIKSPSKFGTFDFNSSGEVTYFGEKAKDASYINGGFFVCDTEVFKYIKDDYTSWEYDVLPELVKDKELSVYKYDGFWKCMDSLKDKLELEKMWNENRAPWKIWK